MKIHEATEQAYKNGYEKGYEDGKRDAAKQCNNIKEYVDYAIHNPNGVACEFPNEEKYNKAFQAELNRLHNAVKHGRWVDRYGGKYANKCFDCSECKGTALYKPEADELGHWRFVQALSDNCPHCGARMDGGTGHDI